MKADIHPTFGRIIDIVVVYVDNPICEVFENQGIYIYM